MERAKTTDAGGGLSGALAFDAATRAGALPPYAFTVLDAVKDKLRRAGRTIYDLGLGNPDGAAPKRAVDVLARAARDPRNHRYAPSAGILPLRRAIARWYKQRYGAAIDPDGEAIVTIGSKEGIAHLLLATIAEGDLVLIPDPCYPIHRFGVQIAGGRAHGVLTGPEHDPAVELERALAAVAPAVPRWVIVNYPHNPTTATCDRAFYEKLVGLARERGFFVLSDLAYADLVFDGGRAPSIFEVPGAKEVAVETFTMSKSYNMAGWRVGFVVGNRRLVAALARVKSYIDYGSFAPIQQAAVEALAHGGDFVADVRETYRSRGELLVAGLARAGWRVPPPGASMFVWARIPEWARDLGSFGFAERLLAEANVAVAPGSGFGPGGEGYVRFALVERETRIRQATRRIARFLRARG